MSVESLEEVIARSRISTGEIQAKEDGILSPTHLRRLVDEQQSGQQARLQAAEAEIARLRAEIDEFRNIGTNVRFWHSQ